MHTRKKLDLNLSKKGVDMGRGDRRRSLKMRQRIAQAKKKARLKKAKEGKK